MAKEELTNDFFYLSEETSMIDPKTFEFSKKHEADTWWLVFPARVHYFDIINRNNRGYLRRNVEEKFFSPKNKDMMQRSRWFGEPDHPFEEFENVHLTRKRIQKVLWPNRSHKLTKPTFTDSYLDLVIETCSGTEVGRGMANDIIQGMIPGFSCRSCGQLQVIGGKPIVMISELITYDSVPYSGFENADSLGKAKMKSASITEEADSTPATISPKSHDILIPWNEIAEDVANKDEKMYAYMESSEGSLRMTGVTPDGKAHLTDGGLHVYAGISQYSLDMVKDFYRSYGKKVR